MSENIKRIILRKGLPSQITLKAASKLTVVAGVGYEFGDYIDCLPLELKVAVRSSLDETWQRVSIIDVKKNGMYYTIKYSILEFMEKGGKYQVKISAASCKNSEPSAPSTSTWVSGYDSVIMPFLSDYIEVVDDRDESSSPNSFSLPLLTDYREITVPLRASMHGASASSSSGTGDQGNTRDYSNDSVTVLIQEDYGATIGSHIWDSSLILCEYLAKRSLYNADSYVPRTVEGSAGDLSVCLELGAGVGLVGLYLAKAKVSRRNDKSLVILTDIQRQMKYLEANIALNAPLNIGRCSDRDRNSNVKGQMAVDFSPSVKCASMVVDWNNIPDCKDDNSAQISHFVCKEGDVTVGKSSVQSQCSYREQFEQLYRYALDDANTPPSSSNVNRLGSALGLNVAVLPVVDLIVAADVLYDQTAISGLFRTLRYFATPRHTEILIAQKKRSAATLVDISVIPGFSSELVHEECNVLILKLVLL